MNPVFKAAMLLLTAALALAGFALLETAHAVLWLLFLFLAYPVLIAFISNHLDGTRFTPAELIKIYRESIHTLPSLLRFIRGMFRADQN